MAKRRKSLTMEERKEVISKIDVLKKTMTQQEACAKIGIDWSSYYRYKKLIAAASKKGVKKETKKDTETTAKRKYTRSNKEVDMQTIPLQHLGSNDDLVCLLIGKRESIIETAKQLFQ